MSPTLTIITINYNNASGLQKTMESVFTQMSKEFEYIIVDGGSTDGSVDYLIAQNLELRTQNSGLSVLSDISPLFLFTKPKTLFPARVVC